jgi:cell division septation protein DedD
MFPKSEGVGADVAWRAIREAEAPCWEEDESENEASPSTQPPKLQSDKASDAILPNDVQPLAATQATETPTPGAAKEAEAPRKTDEMDEKK